MRWTLLVFLGCYLYPLVAAAPQPQDTFSHTVNENTVEEEPNAAIVQTSGGLPEETSTKGSGEEEFSETLEVDEKTSASVQETSVTGRVVNEPPVEEQIPEEVEESEPIKQDQSSEKPANAVNTESNVSKEPVEVSVTTETPTAKPTYSTTARPLAEESPALVTSSRPTTRYPCRCANGVCSCCTGVILENFNVPIRSRACANVTYAPEDFAFNFKLLFNNRILYNAQVSAKNPRPICIPINRFFGIKMCAKLTNVYMSGRNIHACLDMEGYWDDESAFQYSFNCFRIGSNGIAVVRPEDGGGLPPPPDEEEQTDEDYDDSARELISNADYDLQNDGSTQGWVGDVEVVSN
uniref:DUF4773 domain-containing protein n=1 Tax=Homalodisca liturata TaxID=320908 RepID=A0A1B6I8M1_9HEMI